MAPPKEDRRQQLVDSARWVFARQGYHAASIDDVIQRAGVARGTFYNYFENKRAVFQEILEDHFRRIWQSVTPIRVGPGEDVRAQVFENVESLLALFERDPDLGRLMLAVAVGLDPESDRALAGFYGSCRERLARALTVGQTLGFVRKIDPSVLAISLMGTVKEYLSQEILGTSPPARAVFLAEIRHFFESGLLDDVAPPVEAAPKRRRAR